LILYAWRYHWSTHMELPITHAHTYGIHTHTHTYTKKKSRKIREKPRKKLERTKKNEGGSRKKERRKRERTKRKGGKRKRKMREEGGEEKKGKKRKKEGDGFRELTERSSWGGQDLILITLDWHECFPIFHHLHKDKQRKQRHSLKLGKKRQESSKRNYYINSPRVENRNNIITKPWAIQLNQRKPPQKGSSHTWRVLNTDNSDIGTRSRDWIDIQFKNLFSFFFGLSACIPLLGSLSELCVGN